MHTFRLVQIWDGLCLACGICPPYAYFLLASQVVFPVGISLILFVLAKSNRLWKVFIEAYLGYNETMRTRAGQLGELCGAHAEGERNEPSSWTPEALQESPGSQQCRQ